jgi:hypothetical protein
MDPDALGGLQVQLLQVWVNARGVVERHVAVRPTTPGSLAPGEGLFSAIDGEDAFASLRSPLAVGFGASAVDDGRLSRDRFRRRSSSAGLVDAWSTGSNRAVKEMDFQLAVYVTLSARDVAGRERDRPPAAPPAGLTHNGS